MLQKIILIVVLSAVAASAAAQVISIHTYRQQVREVELPSRGLNGFSFHGHDTTLTDTAKLYLTIFALLYRDSLFSERQYFIALTPTVTDTENKLNDCLAYKRLMVVAHYLATNHGMGLQNFRGRFQETVTHYCTGTIGKERRSKGRRGMRKQCQE